MILCYIGIGSNLQHPLQQVTQALQNLHQTTGVRLLRRSPWYVSRAVGPGPQPDYLNGVIELETTLTANDLLRALQEIEQNQGRVRTERWGPRTLDLDILLYGHHCIDTPALQIPHPRMGDRNFVLAPLATLNPQLPLPVPAGGKSATIAALLAALPRDGLHLLDGEHEVITL